MNTDATKLKEYWEDGEMEVCAEEREVKESPSMMEIQKKIPKTETLLRSMWFGDKYKVNQLKKKKKEWWVSFAPLWISCFDFLELGSANFLCKKSYSKYFSLHGPTGKNQEYFHKFLDKIQNL